MRLGVGHPGHKDQVASYVLHDFSKADEDWIGKLLLPWPMSFPAFGGDDQGFASRVAQCWCRPNKTPSLSKRLQQKLSVQKPINLPTPLQRPLHACVIWRVEKALNHDSPPY